MPINFLSLPSELRNTIYELVLLDDKPIYPWARRNHTRNLTPGLFRTNKTIHHEATPLFYAQNTFELTLLQPRYPHISDFFSQIGPTNASTIRHLCLDIPEFDDLDRNNVTFDKDSEDILKLLQNACPNLTTLVWGRYSTAQMELMFERDVLLPYPDVIGKALEFVDTRIRALSSVEEIYVEVIACFYADETISAMKSNGWIIRLEGYVTKQHEIEFF